MGGYPLETSHKAPADTANAHNMGKPAGGWGVLYHSTLFGSFLVSGLAHILLLLGLFRLYITLSPARPVAVWGFLFAVLLTCLHLLAPSEALQASLEAYRATTGTVLRLDIFRRL